MSADTIHRRANATIDIDFYRVRARADRTAAMAAMLRRAGSALRTVIREFRASLRLAARRPMPDPGAVMLIAQAAVRRPRI
jgi:hypothetical protein